ncbi:MAG: hypothetical protein HOV80_17575 [Polyangiaceae bacterium]|nr:hypothetical protein [Polyangiaceae bacterium]
MANNGFEIAGSIDGGAASWFVRSRSGGCLQAAYGLPAVDGSDFESEPFALSLWTATNVTVTDADGPAPGGATPNAARLKPTLASARHHVTGDRLLLVNEGQRVVVGCYVMRAGGEPVNTALGFTAGGDETHGSVGLGASNMAQLESSAANATFSAPDVSIVEDGATAWRLIEVGVTMLADASIRPFVAATGEDGELVWAPSDLFDFDLLVWGAYVTIDGQSEAETFSVGWGADTLLVSIPSSTAALYDNATVTPAAFEAFEQGWGNDAYLRNIATAVEATYDTIPENAEDFEEGWNNDAYLTTITSSATASYDTVPENFEDFAEGWDNDAYMTTISSSTAAVYDETEAFEDFEEVFPDIDVTLDSATDVFTRNAHGLSVNTRVYLGIRNGGSFPFGQDPHALYYLVNVTANTFQLSLTLGGAAVNFTTTGALLFLRGDPAVYWNQLDINATV